MLRARIANWSIDCDDIPYAIILVNPNKILFDASLRNTVNNHELMFTIWYIDNFVQVLNDDNCSDVPNVFIDESTGIVCYRTDCGEVVCEGLDEGPHFYPPSRSK